MQFTCPSAAAAVLPLNPAGRRAEPLLGRLPVRLACRHTAISAPWLSSGRRGHAAAAVVTAGVPPAAAAAAAAPSAAQVSPSAAPSGAALTHFTSLYIRDFALVQEQRLHLAPGLTAITGESGSGKSVLVEALGQVLGAAAYDEAVRPPATTAVVEAAVAVAPQDQPLLRRLLRTLGVPQKAARELGTLVLRRELSKGPDGVRSKCFVNGSPSSVRVLREVGQLLVDVNGQHAALSLKDGATRLRLLDRLAGTTAAADRFAATLAEWQAAQGQLRELDALSDEQQREAFQRLVDEVHAVGVEPGEDRQLRQQLRQLDGRRAAAERCRLVSVGLGGGGGGEGGGIAQALRDVQLQVKQLLSQEERLAAQAAAERDEEEAAAAAKRGGGRSASASLQAGEEEEEDGSDASSGMSSSSGPAEEEGEEVDGGSAAGMLHAAVALLDEAQALLDDAEDRVVQYARLYRFSQAEYDELSKRLQQLERLMKQHDASSADELLEMAEKQGAALDLYFQLEGQRDELEARAAALQQEVQHQAVDLSLRRREAADRLRAAVESVLSDLAMGGSQFAVRMSWTPLSSAAGGSSSGSSADLSSSSLAVGDDEAVGCSEAAGRYRVRPSGLDVVEFLFAAGQGEPLRPLSAVASGGESARVMLALKAAPAFMAGAAAADEADGSEAAAAGSGAAAAGDAAAAAAAAEAEAAAAGGSQILVLDEIDSGIGSRLGQPVGRILRRMAAPGGGLRVGQVLVVSHLPQVAAHAEHHLCVRKAKGPDERLLTRFDLLAERAERLAEISAMAGLPPAAVEELLAAAGQS